MYFKFTCKSDVFNGNDLLSNGATTFLTDALGSTRGLSDTTETLTDSYSYTPYGELQHHAGENNSSFLFTAEQYNPETDDYYLRARYYNPNSSRFLTRDSYDGTAGNPITQNHYLYANGNPMMFTDPSGYAASVAEVSALGSVMGILSSIGSGIRLGALVSKRFAVNSIPALRKAVSNNGGGVVGLSHLSAIYTIARLYAKTIAREDDPLEMTPIQVYGSSNLPEHQAHIESAMLGLGSNKKPTPAVLHKAGSDINDRNFLGRKTVCGGYPRADGQHCDEYPYNSSFEGGTANYDSGHVSIKLVSGSESRSQGRFIRKFYSKALVRNGNAFLVIPIGGISGFFDKRGMWHEY